MRNRKLLKSDDMTGTNKGIAQSHTCIFVYFHCKMVYWFNKTGTNQAPVDL